MAVAGTSFLVYLDTELITAVKSFIHAYRNKLECLPLPFTPPKSNVCGQSWELTIGVEYCKAL
jgi:hypothetical protein